MRAERLSTDFPFVSLTLFSMTDKIACSDFSSCRTLLIGAKELRRIFLGFCVLHTFTAYPLMRFFPTQWEILPPDKGALPNKYYLENFKRRNNLEYPQRRLCCLLRTHQLNALFPKCKRPLQLRTEGRPCFDL